MNFQRRETWARIIIVDYRSSLYLQDCLIALQNQSFDNFEVVIVDNNDHDQDILPVALPDDRFKLVKSPLNSGYAGGSNFGAKGATTSWLIMLNPDTRPHSDWLAELNIASEIYRDAVMFGTTLTQAGSEGHLDGFGDALSILGLAWKCGVNQRIANAPNSDRYVFGPCGAAAMYSRNIFEAMGGFEADFFCYMEDVDFAWRVGRSGGQCVQVHKAYCAHVGGVSSHDQPDFSQYYTARNTVWMIAASSPRHLLVPMLVLNFIAKTYLGVRGRYGSSRSAVFRGLIDGWVGIIPHLTARRKRLSKTPSLGLKRGMEKPIFSLAALRERRIVSQPIKD